MQVSHLFVVDDFWNLVFVVKSFVANKHGQWTSVHCRRKKKIKYTNCKQIIISIGQIDLKFLEQRREKQIVCQSHSVPSLTSQKQFDGIFDLEKKQHNKQTFVMNNFRFFFSCVVFCFIIIDVQITA